VPTTTAT
jgi:GTPase